MELEITSVAIIGSFRQYYDCVKEAITAFESIGLSVTSPKGDRIIEEQIPFVRFRSDPDSWNDETVQTVALHRIMSANFVYVVSPNGYIGRTTCYEIGRLIQIQKPVYFSHKPKDLPILISKSSILSIEEIVTQLSDNTFVPQPLYNRTGDTNFQYQLELDLLDGKLRSI